MTVRTGKSKTSRPAFHTGSPPSPVLTAKQYYFDYPAANPRARFINISPDLNLDGSTWSYSAGSTRYNWTASAIDAARTAGIKWVIVSMHKYCISAITTGAGCDVGSDLMNLLIDKEVDLYLPGARPRVRPR